MDARDRTVRSRSAWRVGVPVVCAAAGLLLGATYSVSGGDEIRRSDAPRLVDLVRETQQSVDRLTAERDALSPQIENHHGGSPSAAAMQRALSEAPLVTLYKQYAVRFGLGYQEEAREVELVGYTAPITMKYAQPIGPLGY